jgi:hypothetical protein
MVPGIWYISVCSGLISEGAERSGRSTRNQESHKSIERIREPRPSSFRVASHVGEPDCPVHASGFKPALLMLSLVPPPSTATPGHGDNAAPNHRPTPDPVQPAVVANASDGQSGTRFGISSLCRSRLADWGPSRQMSLPHRTAGSPPRTPPRRRPTLDRRQSQPLAGIVGHSSPERIAAALHRLSRWLRPASASLSRIAATRRVG